MIGQIVRTSDFDKNLIVNSKTKNYNSNYSESSIKNINYEFGDIFSDLTTISNYRTGNLNFIAMSGKENSDEINGTIINFTLPENFKEINSIKLIVAINDFEIYTSNISDSIFSKCEILPNTQSEGQMEEQVLGSVSGQMMFHNENFAGDYIKDYIYQDNQKKINSTETNATGLLITPSNFRSFKISNIEWTPDAQNVISHIDLEEFPEMSGLINHYHEFVYLANLLDGWDHVHTIISDDHSHNYSFPDHIHFVDQDHVHQIKFLTHSHQINTNHYHNIAGENLFFKNFNANKINIQEINKNFNISGFTELDLTNYKSNFSNKITLKPNAKCNLTYFVLIELYCVENG